MLLCGKKLRQSTLVILTILASCSNTSNHSEIETILLDTNKISDYREQSDTGYTRNIGAGEFYSSEQLFDADDSVITKIMKDTSGKIVSVLQFQKGIRKKYEEYYPNGQLKGKLPLNDAGEFEGEAKYYYENGRVKSKGYYKNGLFTGEWKNFDAKGKYVSTEFYNDNGQLVRTEKH